MMFTGGCSSLFESTHPVQFSNDQLEKINASLKNNPSTVYLKDGSQIKARSILVTRDSTLLWDSTNVYTSTLHNAEINEIHTIDHSRGGADGITIGVGVGLTIFAATVLTSKLYDDSGYYAYYSAYVAIGAIPIGLAVGSYIGHSYQFTYPSDSTQNGSALDM